MNHPVEMGYPRESLLEHALSKMHQKAMSLERNQETLREKALQAVKQQSSELGEDPSLLCQAMAAQEKTPRKSRTEDYHWTYFTETAPIGPKQASSGIILSTYFGSKIHPRRCWQYRNGRLPHDSWPHVQPFYDAIERLDLEAVVFHDEALSEEFVEEATTSAMLFQKVALQRSGWSPAEERWAIFRDWLDSDAAEEINWVLAVDLEGWTMASSPFSLMESSDWGWFNLWTDALPASPEAVSRFDYCYGTHEGGPNLAPPLHEKNQTYNSGILGGTRASFLELSSAMIEEFEALEDQRRYLEADVWNCEVPVLHRVLREGGPLSGQRVFAKGHPFCGSADACALHGLCDYVMYRDE